MITDEKSFAEYVEEESRIWKEAKTFKDFAPHSYVLSFPCRKMKRDKLCPLPEYPDPIESMAVCQQCQDARTEFEQAVQFIRDNGKKALFLKKIYIVYRLGKYQYWTMGDPLSTTWVLNRALIDDPNAKVKTIILED